RDSLVKELRAGGDQAEAQRLRKLRRPTAAAWLINRVALDSPALLEEFAAASGAVEDAQKRALQGDDEAATEWRTAAAREREETAEALRRDKVKLAESKRETTALARKLKAVERRARD